MSFTKSFMSLYVLLQVPVKLLTFHAYPTRLRSTPRSIGANPLLQFPCQSRTAIRERWSVPKPWSSLPAPAPPQHGHVRTRGNSRPGRRRSAHLQVAAVTVRWARVTVAWVPPVKAFWTWTWRARARTAPFPCAENTQKPLYALKISHRSPTTCADAPKPALVRGFPTVCPVIP